MSNRYLYKAKRTDNGEWVEGYYCPKKTGHYENGKFIEGIQHIIIVKMTGGGYQYAVVDPSTICQCTGLKDRNGKLIWENDIVKFEDTGEEGYEYKECFDYINRAKVVWNKGRFELDSFLSNNSGTLELMNSSPEEFYDMFEEYAEVIGSAIDNPELLEGVQNE